MQIVYSEADGNYTRIHLLSGKIETVTQNLGSIALILQRYNFFRMNRSSLVNLDYVSIVNRKAGICTLEYNDVEVQVRAPAQKIRQLEKLFEEKI